MKKLINKFKEYYKKEESKLWKNVYNEIPTTIYNTYAKIDSTQPNIYNELGEKLTSFYIRDFSTCTSCSKHSRYIYWDKYNFELDYHFYSHGNMLKTYGNPKLKYGALIETKGICPQEYEIFKNNKGLEKEFNYIFTYDDEILNTIENARFVPFCASIKLDFYNIENSLSEMKEDLYTQKTKNISILSSNKQMCDLHKLRLQTAEYFKYSKLVDTFGTFLGEEYFVKAYETLKDYRYSIVFENDISDYCFTEKITNCFAMQTIPIYLGAKKIDRFFNTDGIIQLQIKDIENIDQILKNCNEEDYNSRIEAIKDNYNRVQEYKNVEDFMFLKYMKKDIIKC